MSKPKRRWPDLFRRRMPSTRQGTTSDPSPASTATPVNPGLAEVSSTQTTPSVSQTTASASAQQVAKLEDRTATGVLRTALGALQTSLQGLPSLKLAIDGLVECVSHLQIQEQNRKSFEVLTSQLADLANLLQKHVVESKPQNVPYSIEFVARNISEQTNIIKQYQDRPKISRAASALEDQEIVLEGYRRICALFQQLQADISLSIWDILQRQQMDNRIERLAPAYDARYNTGLSTTVAKRVSCTKNTRVKLLEDARIWAGDGSAAKIHWLNGMAGTGKTTIAYTICRMLDADRRLAASYFCSRDSPDCRDVRKIVPTIAYQLGRYSTPYKKALCDVLEEDPDAAKSDINTQFERLVSKPLAEIGSAMPNNVVVVIDALDECTDEAGTKDVLNMLIRHAANMPIKFFVASRPEPAITQVMESYSDVSRLVIRLHDIEQSLVQADITLYLTEALASIDISPSEIEQLAARAGNLFIFAATAVRYILPDKGVVNRAQRLQTVLGLQSSQKHRSKQYIDNLYVAILANALDEEVYEEVETITKGQVLWTAICAREPLTIPALSEVLHLSDEEVWTAIQPLQSVLHVSTNTSAVSALHASFPEFLLAKERAGRFHCDEVIQNSALAVCCFKFMAQSLNFNICALESSYMFDKDVPDLQDRVDRAISTGLFYSCRYWGDHLTRSSSSPILLSLLDSFLQQRLLFWMEALNLSQAIGHGDVVLGRALAWLPTEDEWAELRDLTYDARNFLASFAGNPTSRSTPHIYVSTPPFTSKESRVRAAYWPRTRGQMKIGGIATEGRGKSVLATWEVGSPVLSVAQSSDGRRVASGSGNCGVSVWDVSSGVRTLGPLKGHEGVWSAAFSPDNSRIASGSLDHTIRVWDAHNGDLLVGPLHGHTSDVFSVAFSPDGTRLASGSNDRTIRMWDAHTGAAIGDAYRGHQGAVYSVAFSPDGEHLASGSQDHTIRVWKQRTGVEALGPMQGHTESVRSIAYSSDGSCLASGSSDKTVRMWDMSRGVLLASPLEINTTGVLSVSFSPNDAQVVSGSNDGTIRVWEVESGKLLAGPFEGQDGPIRAALFATDGTRILSGSEDGTVRVWDARRRTTSATKSLRGYDGIISVAMSPDGTRAASGSQDKTICVWDAHNGTLVVGPFMGHTDVVNSVAFSPDGARIVSGSHDRTLRTWDASTGALLVGPIKSHTNWISSVTFSPNGSQIASGSRDHTIRLWDSHTGQSIVEPFSGHIDWVYSIAFSPNGTRVISGSRDKTVRMWDASTGTTLWTSHVHTDYVYCVAFSPDGACIVSGSGDKTILVLDTADGAVLHSPLIGHTESVRSVAFSPDGTRVVSGSGDRTVLVWDVQSGAVVVGPLKGHTRTVASVVLSPHGARIISGSYDGTIRFWDIAAAIRPNAASFDGWFIDDNGWVIDSHSQRLFWVPPDVRDGFWFPTPSNPLVSNARSTTRVDHTMLLGDRWHKCYDESLGSFPP